MSGLSAATTLRDAGVDVVVVEARDRVGGRVCSDRLDDGTAIDLGGQWIGADHDRLKALSARYAARTLPQFGSGDTILYAGRTRTMVRGRVPFRLGPAALPMLAAGILRLDRMARRVPLEAPWTAPDARTWDAQTLATWLDRNVPHKRARAILTSTLRGILAAEPGEVSLLHALVYIRAGGGLESLSGTTGAAQDEVFVDGVQPLAERMAADLDIVFDAPVHAITQTADAVSVSFERNTIEAQRAIVAVPPTLAGRLVYTPPMPPARDQLTQRMPQGRAVKCLAVYDQPFWRADGLSGLVLDSDGPVSMVIDGTRDPERNGILIAFIEGSAATSVAAADRRTVILQSLERHFGPAAATPREYVDRDWSTEPHTRGCYAGVMPPGVWTAFGDALRTPVGRIHWAGTETATDWMGYIEGALRAGERAAAEILQARPSTVGREVGR